MRPGTGLTSKVAVVLSGLLAALLLSPAVTATSLLPASAPAAGGVELASALAADGTFVGAPGMSGSVDTSAWTLVSDLAAGEAPRFGPAGEDPGPVAADVGSWSALGSNGAGNGAVGGAFPAVYAVAVMGTNLYIGGSFSDVAGKPAADHIAKWNGSSWSALGPQGTIDNIVYALRVSGSNLFVGGGFTDAAGIPTADYIARWNGSAWFALGSNGSGNGALNSAVMSLAGTSSNLYAGGFFFNAAGVPEADYVARWSGGEWHALGSNSAGNGALGAVVRAIALVGSDVYVGGDFSNAASNNAADYIAKFNGSAWLALGADGGGGGLLSNRVYALAVSGFDVYVGGQFTDAAGIPEADYIARWTSPSWHAVGSSGPGVGPLNNVVLALAISGNDLYAGGMFTDANGEVRADYVARWNGSIWYALGSNGAANGALNARVWALAPGSLYVGGEFFDAAGKPKADYIAKWTPLTPDGRIRKGTGAYVGNNIYNSTGLNQSRSGTAARGSTITFGISIQNDGTLADSFRVLATGSATTKYTVRYFRGTTEITAAVVGGTYQTPSLAPADKYLITAKVKVGSTATLGSSVSRLVTITSVGDANKLDAVKFTGKRG